MDNIINMNQGGQAPSPSNKPAIWPEADLVQDINWNFFLREKGEEGNKIWISNALEKGMILQRLQLVDIITIMDIQLAKIMNKDMTYGAVPLFDTIIHDIVVNQLKNNREYVISAWLETLPSTLADSTKNHATNPVGYMMDDTYESFTTNALTTSPIFKIDSPIGVVILNNLTDEELDNVIPKIPYHVWIGYLNAYIQNIAVKKEIPQDPEKIMALHTEYMKKYLHCTDKAKIKEILQSIEL